MEGNCLRRIIPQVERISKGKSIKIRVRRQGVHSGAKIPLFFWRDKIFLRS
jgi:hypothetical protein